MEIATLDWLQILVQGGAVGIAILLILTNRSKEKMYNKTMNNHLQHTELAQHQVAKSNVELSVALTKLSEKISGCPNNKLNK